MKKLNILKCGDQYNWAYDYLSREQALYSKHNIMYVKHNEVMDNIKLADIVYIHSPDISPWHAIDLPKIAHEMGKKVITQYSGNPAFWSEHEKPIYSYSDCVVTISPQLYQFAKNHYHNVPIIYLPESVDTDFFRPVDRVYSNTLKIGWAGGFHKKIKRGYLLEQLDYDVSVQDTWRANRDKTEQGIKNDLSPMLDFYQSIDCLIVTSLSECMPRVVMEAMGCGCSVIGTDVGSMRLLLDKKFILPTNPDDDLVKRANELLYLLDNDYALREYTCRNNRMKAELFFSWKINQSLWDDVFTMVYDGDKIDGIDNQWLDKFRDEFDSSIIEPTESTGKSKSLSDMEIRDIIRYLNDNKVDYYLLESSCLDCIRYEELKINKEILFIGGDSTNIQEALGRCGFVKEQDIYVRKNVKVVLRNDVMKQTKEMPFYGLLVNVPYPVVSYLTHVYGKDWNKK